MSQYAKGNVFSFKQRLHQNKPNPSVSRPDTSQGIVLVVIQTKMASRSSLAQYVRFKYVTSTCCHPRKDCTKTTSPPPQVPVRYVNVLSSTQRLHQNHPHLKFQYVTSTCSHPRTHCTKTTTIPSSSTLRQRVINHADIVPRPSPPQVPVRYVNV